MLISLFRGAAKSSLKECLPRSSNIPICYSLVRNVGHWNKDFKPGPYPKTEEERREAAKKYFLIPEDYEPFDDKDGLGYGDYPKLPVKSDSLKDPYVNYDVPHLRRNFCEPMNVDADVLTEDKMIPDERMQYSYPTMLRKFFTAVGGIALFMYIGPEDGLIRDTKPKHIWSPGVVHYSFDLEGSEDHH